MFYKIKNSYLLAKTNQQGAVSIYVSIAVMLIMLIIGLSFAHIMRNNYIDTTETQLNLEAHYAAETALLDGRKIVKAYLDSRIEYLTSYGLCPGSLGCATPVTPPPPTTFNPSSDDTYTRTAYNVTNNIFKIDNVDYSSISMATMKNKTQVIKREVEGGDTAAKVTHAQALFDHCAKYNGSKFSDAGASTPVTQSATAFVNAGHAEFYCSYPSYVIAVGTPDVYRNFNNISYIDNTYSGRHQAGGLKIYEYDWTNSTWKKKNECVADVVPHGTVVNSSIDGTSCEVLEKSDVGHSLSSINVNKEFGFGRAVSLFSNDNPNINDPSDTYDPNNKLYLAVAFSDSTVNHIESDTDKYKVGGKVVIYELDTSDPDNWEWSHKHHIDHGIGTYSSINLTILKNGRHFAIQGVVDPQDLSGSDCRQSYQFWHKTKVDHDGDSSTPLIWKISCSENITPFANNNKPPSFNDCRTEGSEYRCFLTTDAQLKQFRYSHQYKKIDRAGGVSNSADIHPSLGSSSVGPGQLLYKPNSINIKRGDNLILNPALSIGFGYAFLEFEKEKDNTHNNCYFSIRIHGRADGDPARWLDCPASNHVYDNFGSAIAGYNQTIAIAAKWSDSNDSFNSTGSATGAVFLYKEGDLLSADRNHNNNNRSYLGNGSGDGANKVVLSEGDQFGYRVDLLKGVISVASKDTVYIFSPENPPVATTAALSGPRTGANTHFNRDLLKIPACINSNDDIKHIQYRPSPGAAKQSLNLNFVLDEDDQGIRVGYSCLDIDLNPDVLYWEQVSHSKTLNVVLKPIIDEAFDNPRVDTKDIKMGYLRIKWAYSDKQLASSADRPNWGPTGVNYPRFPAEANWNAKAPIIRVHITPFDADGFNREQLIKYTKTYYFYPDGTGTPTPIVYDLPNVVDSSEHQSGFVAKGQCQDDYNGCVGIIKNLPHYIDDDSLDISGADPSNGDINKEDRLNFLVNISSFYGDADIELKGYKHRVGQPNNPAGDRDGRTESDLYGEDSRLLTLCDSTGISCRFQFRDIQAIVEATGHAADSIKVRLSERIPLQDPFFGTPYNTVNTATSLCKTLIGDPDVGTTTSESQYQHKWFFDKNSISHVEALDNCAVW